MSTLNTPTQSQNDAKYAAVSDLQARGILVPLSNSNSGAQNSTALLSANASAASLGVPLILPPGSFSLDPTVIPPRDRLTIQGSGAAYQSGIGTKLINTSNTGGDLLSISGGDPALKAWEIVIEDLELVGITGSGNGLVLSSAGTGGSILGNVSICRVASHGHGQSGFKAQGRIDQLRFDQTIARDNGVHGYDMTTFNLLSEAVLINVHGSSNTDHGLYVGGTVFACTVIASEFSSNGQIGYEMSSALGGNANSFSAIGVHSEKNGLYHAQFGSNSVNSVVLDSCHFLDNSVSGINAFINIRVRTPGSLIVRNCVASGKTDGITLVSETGNGRIPLLEGSAITTSTGTSYLRKTSTGTLTNDWQGGITADIPSTNYARTGDSYYDTSMSQLKRFYGGIWSATGTGPAGPTGPSGAATLIRSGYWHRTGSTFSTSNTLGNGSLRAVPIQAQRSLSLDQLSVEITTAGQSGATVRLGVFADDGTGTYPGLLLSDAGSVAADVTGVPTLTIATSIPFTAGTTYWLAAVVQNATTTQPTLRTFTAGVPLVPTGTATPSGTGAPLGWSNAGVTGGMPSTFTTSPTSVGSGIAIGYHFA